MMEPRCNCCMKVDGSGEKQVEFEEENLVILAALLSQCYKMNLDYSGSVYSSQALSIPR